MTCASGLWFSELHTKTGFRAATITPQREMSMVCMIQNSGVAMRATGFELLRNNQFGTGMPAVTKNGSLNEFRGPGWEEVQYEA